MTEPQLSMFEDLKDIEGLKNLDEEIDKQFASGAVQVKHWQLLPRTLAGFAVVSIQLGAKRDGRQRGDKFLYLWSREQLLEFANDILQEFGPRQPQRQPKSKFSGFWGRMGKR